MQSSDKTRLRSIVLTLGPEPHDWCARATSETDGPNAGLPKLTYLKPAGDDWCKPAVYALKSGSFYRLRKNGEYLFLYLGVSGIPHWFNKRRYESAERRYAFSLYMTGGEAAPVNDDIYDLIDAPVGVSNWEDAGVCR